MPSKNVIDRISKQFNPEDSDFDQAYVVKDLSRTQRVIDISAGISHKDKEIFPHANTVKGKDSIKFSNMSSLYETDGNRIFSSGRKSLKDLDIRTLPELNPEYPKQYFRKIRKAMFQQIQEQRGRAKIQPKSSVDYVQRFQSGPRALFVTEYDKVWPDEPEPVVGEKKKKAKDPEPKYYAHHKY